MHADVLVIAVVLLIAAVIPGSLSQFTRRRTGPCELSVRKSENQCRSRDGLVCSGRGWCECGKCVCLVSEPGTFYGSRCECQVWLCETFNGKVCGGFVVTAYPIGALPHHPCMRIKPCSQRKGLKAELSISPHRCPSRLIFAADPRTCRLLCPVQPCSQPLFVKCSWNLVLSFCDGVRRYCISPDGVVLCGSDYPAYTSSGGTVFTQLTEISNSMGTFPGRKRRSRLTLLP